MQNAEASQTGDPENVSNAIDQSADFSKFDSESSIDDDFQIYSLKNK